MGGVLTALGSGDSAWNKGLGRMLLLGHFVWCLL